MTAHEWLDAVRADLDVIERPWSFEPASAGWTLEDAGYVFGIVSNVNSAVLIASAPDRLDKMERALRAVLELAEAVNAAAIIPTSTPIMNAGYRAALGDVVTAIQEALG